MGHKFFRKLFNFLLSFLLLFQGSAPYLVAFAQEASDSTPSAEIVVEPSPSPSPSPTPDPTSEATISPTPEITPTPQPTPTATAGEAEPTPEVTPEPSPTPEVIIPTPDPTPEVSPTPTSEVTSTPTLVPTPTPTPSTTSSPELTVQDQTTSGALVSLFNLLTDKPDYSPTDTAIISGSELLSLTAYTLTISSTDDPAVTFSTPIITDASGNFAYSYQLDGNYRPNYLVELKNGSGNIVTSTTFTDSVKTWAGCSDTNWNNSANWSNDSTLSCPETGSVPASGDTAVIPTGRANYPDISSGTVTIDTLTINAGGSVTVSGGTLSATANDLNTSGTLNISSGTVTTGTGKSFKNSTNLTMSGGVLITKDFSNTGTNTVSGGTIKISHDFKPNNFSASGGTIEFTDNNGNGAFPGTANTPDYQFNNILIDSGITTQFDNATVTYGVSGNWTNNGTATLTGTATTVTFNGNGAQTIGGSSGTTFRNMTINKPSGTATLSGSQTVSNGNLTVSAGTLDLSSFTFNRSAGGGTLTVANGATLKVGGTNSLPTNYTTHTLGASSTVEYSGTAQTVANETYGNLIFSGSGAKSMGSGTSTSGNLSIAPAGSATANVGAGLNLTVNSLTLGGLGRINGTWGSTSSSATNQNNTYFAATTGSLTVTTDTRATPNVTTWPSASGITNGQALSASTLSGGSASTTGSFTFTAPATTPPAGTYSASVTFTPTDTTSYKTVTGNVNVTVAANTYTLTYTPGANGSLTGISPQTVDYGASGTGVTAVPNTGYHFTTWSDGVLTASRTDSEVTADVTVTASFAINTYTITFDSAGGSAVSSITKDYGSAVTAPANPTKAGYTFTGWSPAVPETMPLNGASLTAQWTENAPVISAETSSSTAETSTTITWTTDHDATSRVIYDTVSHATANSTSDIPFDKYGYANTTDEFDTSPKVTSHSVSLTGLTAGTTYYYRTVSHGSPEAVSEEKSVTTTSSSSSSSGGGGTSPASAPVCSDTKPGSAPVLLSAVSAGTNSVILTWSKAADPVTYYLITFGLGSGLQQYGNPNVGGSNTTSYTVSGLSGGTTYYFKVRAGNGCAPGTFSNELSATPTGGVLTTVPGGFEAGVLGESTEAGINPTPTATIEPTPTPEVKGTSTSNFNWWLLTIPGALLVLFISGLLLRRRT